MRRNRSSQTRGGGRLSLLLGAVVLLIVTGGIALLGVTVGGFSIGTWLAAMALMKASHQEPPPSVQLTVAPKAIEVVRIEASTTAAEPQETQVFVGAFRSDRQDVKTDRLIVFVRDERPTKEALEALEPEGGFAMDQQVEGVGAVATVMTVPSWRGFFTDADPALRLPPEGGFLTLLSPEAELDVEVGVDAEPMRRACDCEVDATVTATTPG